MISAGAKILGSITIGDNAKVGAGAVVLREVPPNTTVVGVPGRVVVQDGVRVKSGVDLAHDQIPDPVAKMIECLQQKINELENRNRRASRVGRHIGGNGTRGKKHESNLAVIFIDPTRRINKH